MIPLIWVTESIHIHRDNIVKWWLPGAGEKNEKLLFNGYRVTVLQDKNSPRNGWW